jgi:enamine deaminase RidA (YjgF/YER057c/UK114 family)
MADKTAAQAVQKGIIIPSPPKTGAYHIPVVRTGNLLYLSGQTPSVDGERIYLGMVGKDLSKEEGHEAARIAALNMIAQINEFLEGELDRVKRCVRLTGYVNSAPDFYDQAEVIHGASKTVIDIFGEERGLHARAAFGLTPTTFNVSIVIDGIWEVE